jgi:hypothetical protein
MRKENPGKHFTGFSLIDFVHSVVKRGVIRSVLTRTVNCIILTLDCGFVDSVVKHGTIYKATVKC